MFTPSGTRTKKDRNAANLWGEDGTPSSSHTFPATLVASTDFHQFPRSRRPHFNEAAMRAGLNMRGIGYLHLGNQLGGQVTDEEASHVKRSTMPRFIEGIDRVLDIAGQCQPALFCAEGEVLDCHRFLILSRYLAERSNVKITHILRDGRTETQAQTEDRLLQRMRLTTDLFSDRSEQLGAAYTAKLLRMGLRP